MFLPLFVHLFNFLVGTARTHEQCVNQEREEQCQGDCGQHTFILGLVVGEGIEPPSMDYDSTVLTFELTYPIRWSAGTDLNGQPSPYQGDYLTS